jgi:hypothetical protein
MNIILIVQIDFDHQNLNGNTENFSMIFVSIYERKFLDSPFNYKYCENLFILCREPLYH